MRPFWMGKALETKERDLMGEKERHPAEKEKAGTRKEN